MLISSRNNSGYVFVRFCHRITKLGNLHNQNLTDSIRFLSRIDNYTLSSIFQYMWPVRDFPIFFFFHIFVSFYIDSVQVVVKDCHCIAKLNNIPWRSSSYRRLLIPVQNWRLYPVCQFRMQVTWSPFSRLSLSVPIFQLLVELSFHFCMVSETDWKVGQNSMTLKF